MDRINELSQQITDAIAELRDTYGVYGAMINQEEIGFHMSAADLKKHFPIYLERDREREEYPVELYVVVNGVRFFALEKRLREAV